MVASPPPLDETERSEVEVEKLAMHALSVASPATEPEATANGNCCRWGLATGPHSAAQSFPDSNKRVVALQHVERGAGERVGASWDL